MKRNSRFSLALHTLSHMAFAPDQHQTSDQIAAHAGTNPVVVRRVLGKLRKAGLLSSERGHAGGWRLARPPHHITLADVYTALEESFVSSHAQSAPETCSVEHALETQVAQIMQDVETTLVSRLTGTTIADIREAATKAPGQAH